MRALVTDEDHRSTIRDVDLPAGEVTVAVEYSTVNYKDGLCLTGQAGLVKHWPHVGGIDFAGVVEASDDPRYAPGDRVVLTGWRVGELHWGGYATQARVKADWLVRLPDAISTRDAMAIGTAGLTAMLSVIALEDHGIDGEVLVTGASGGVGSVAVALLAALGHRAVASSGRDPGYLESLGAARVIGRLDGQGKPLEAETWGGCIDSVGGAALARVLAQMRYGGSVALVGLAGGIEVPTTVMPFILRGVNLLGIDSVLHPYDARVRAWNRLATDLPLDKLHAMIHPAVLADVPDLCHAILRGEVRGRVVVDVNG